MSDPNDIDVVGDDAVLLCAVVVAAAIITVAANISIQHHPVGMVM